MSPEKPSLTISQGELGASREACCKLLTLVPVGNWKGPLLSEASSAADGKPVTAAPSPPNRSPDPSYYIISSSHNCLARHWGMLVRKFPVTAAQACVTGWVSINVLMPNLIPRAFWFSFFGHA